MALSTYCDQRVTFFNVELTLHQKNQKNIKRSLPMDISHINMQPAYDIPSPRVSFMKDPASKGMLIRRREISHINMYN